MEKIKGIKADITKEKFDEILTIVWNAVADILIKTGMAVEVREESENAE